MDHSRRIVAPVGVSTKPGEDQIDDAEVEAVVAFLTALHATDLGERGDLAQQFRALRSDDMAADDAADLLIRDASYLLPYVLSAAERLAEVDGRVTPKERERLDWMGYKLGEAATRASLVTV
jgi:hypothetical protein